MFTKITAPNAAPNAGAYSPALKVGDFVFVSGQGPLDVKGNIVSGSIESEVALTLDNVAALLAAAGAGMEQVVKCTCYLADLADFDAFDRVYRTYFGEVKPTRTTVAAGLVGIRIEIDAMAYIGRS